MIPQKIIVAKRDGEALTADDLRAFMTAYLDGAVSEEQMAAFLMAIYFNGLNDDELGALVAAIMESGRVMETGGWQGPRVDKHSTGGVGDKTSLVLAPLAAEMGMVVPMISGRGLGHTGGTLDKLEAIPGFRTSLSLDEFDRVLGRIGCAMIGQTAELAPLDRRLYALRDVTGTVPSRPLITASIMAKKLVEGLAGLVLDVKVGRGGFMERHEDAHALATALCQVGEAHGLVVTAVLSAMDRPLGRSVGNALETEEALACLGGGGPADLRELCLELAAEMAFAGGIATSPEAGRRAAEAALSGGGAMERFLKMVALQGGRLSDDGRELPRAPEVAVVEAEREGIVAAIDPLALGYGLIRMGGGRTQSSQEINPGVGFRLAVGVGDGVRRGDPLAELCAATSEGLEEGMRALREAISLEEEGAGGAADQRSPVIDRIRCGIPSPWSAASNSGR